MHRAGLAAGATAAAAAGLLVASQLVLPGIAERRLRERLERVGTVTGVDVDAFPALTLLWDRADRVDVRMSDSTARRTRLADLLDRTRRAGEVDARVERVRIGLLSLRDLRLRKRGDALRAQASVDEADLRAALPDGLDVRPVAAGGGQLVFEGTARLLGRRLRARAVVTAHGGRLLLSPAVPFGGLLTVTVFQDRRIAVDDVGARARRGGFTLTASATLT